MSNQLDSLIREMARTWKEGGGDAMGFHWCVDRIRLEILQIEQEQQGRSAADCRAHNPEVVGSNPTPASIECWCYECNKGKRDERFNLPIEFTRMILCPDCGNKRCPRATNHELACTNSNEPGQPGSRYEAF